MRLLAIKSSGKNSFKIQAERGTGENKSLRIGKGVSFQNGSRIFLCDKIEGGVMRK